MTYYFKEKDGSTSAMRDRVVHMNGGPEKFFKRLDKNDWWHSEETDEDESDSFVKGID